MRAVVISDDDASGLRLAEVPEPVVGPHDLQIEVRAAGVNRADVAQREGRYAQHATARPDAPRIAGLEVSGVVRAMGAQVTGHRVGDEVMTMCSGGYAELVCVDHRLVLPKPPTLSFEQAAAVPVAFITAHDAVVTNAWIQPGDRVLVAGGSSVVGLAAAQVARLWEASHVVGTAGGANKAAQLLESGFDQSFDYHEERIESLVDLGPYDVVIDMVAGDWMPVLIDSLRPGGRLVSVGRLRGTDVAFNLDTVARNRLSVIGVSFRTRSMDEYAAVVRRAADDLLPRIADGSLRPAAVQCYPIDAARDAQDHMEQTSDIGKVVLTFP